MQARGQGFAAKANVGYNGDEEEETRYAALHCTICMYDMYDMYDMCDMYDMFDIYDMQLCIV